MHRGCREQGTTIPSNAAFISYKTFFKFSSPILHHPTVNTGTAWVRVHRGDSANTAAHFTWTQRTPDKAVSSDKSRPEDQQRGSPDYGSLGETPRTASSLIHTWTDGRPAI